jgi:thioredoxin-dependent peroxiredoxin
MPPQVGKPAPAFSLPSTHGAPIALKDLKGQKVVLYFYPRDNTSGCTREACAFRDIHPDFSNAGAVVLGVSPDGLSSHENFRGKYELPFILLADEGHAIAEEYGVWKEKSLYGRKYMGIERTTFIIDSAGKIARIFPKVKVDGHAEEVLEAVRDCP